MCLVTLPHPARRPAQLNSTQEWKRSTGEQSQPQKRRQRSSLLLGGQKWFNSLPHYRFSARMIWRNGLIEKYTLGRMCTSGKMDDLLVHTLAKWMFFQTLPIILAAFKYTSPKQQRWSLPSFLYKFLFYSQNMWPCVIFIIKSE